MITGKNITEELILSISNQMSAHLQSEQLSRLKDVLFMELIKYDISVREKENEITNTDVDTMNLQILNNFCLSKGFDGKSEQTCKRYYEMLKPMLLSINKPIDHISTADIQGYLYNYKFKRNVCNNTLDGMRRIMSSFFNWCRIKKYIIEDPSEGLQKIKVEKKVKHILTDEELEVIKMHCGNPRDIAMIDLFTCSGIRVSELSKLNISDVDFANKTILIHGKGNKQRIVYFDGKTKVRLEDYLNTRNDDNPALFVTLKKYKGEYCRYEKKAIESTIRKLGRECNLSDSIFPHKFRSKCATDMVRKGMPIEKVSKILGHEKLETTQIYVEVSETDTRDSYHKYMG